MSEHPCHNLSNTEKQIFTCRHCMAKFVDPIQRWRHSKNCKRDAPLKGKDGTISPNSTGKREHPAENGEKFGGSKKRQKKEGPLSCLICKSVFTTLEEMKEHVKHPCSKPVVSKSQPQLQANPELDNFEQQLQQLREAKGDDIATNQIESLLKAAQALHQQQQEQQRQQTQQLQNVETEVIPDGGNPGWLYNQSEPVLCSVEEYGEPAFPSYSSMEGSDGMQVVRVEQVTSTPPVDEDRSLHTPPISLVADDYKPGPTQEIALTSANQDAPTNNTQISFSGPQVVNFSHENRDLPVSFESSTCNNESSTAEKFILSTVGVVDNFDSQLASSTQNAGSAGGHPIVVPSEVRLVGSDGMTVTLVLSPEAPSVTTKTGNPGDEFDLISQVIGEDLNQQEPAEKSRENFSKFPDVDTKANYNSNKAPGVDMSGGSNFSENGHNFKWEQTITSEQDIINKGKNEQCNTSENLKHSEQINTGTNSEKVTVKCLSGEHVVKKQESTNLKEKEYNDDCKCTSKDQEPVVNDVMDQTKTSDAQTSSKQNFPETDLKSQSEVKVPKKKPKTERIPKCRICDKVFRTIELLRKHNKVPCKVRLTRNLTQKVLRPKKLEKPVPQQTAKKKKKQKPAPAKPKMITLINRRFSDTRLELNKDKKGKLKTRRKSMYDFNFCITRSSEYRNASLDVLVKYDSLNEKEQHFFHLGLVASVHLPSDYKTPKSLIRRVLKENGSRILEKVVDRETVDSVEKDEPPVLEKVVDAAGRLQEDIYILRDEINDDIEPPVLTTVEELASTCAEVDVSEDMECPVLSTSSDEDEVNGAILPMKEQVSHLDELNKENKSGCENLATILPDALDSEKLQFKEQISKPSTQSKNENRTPEKLTASETVSPLKSPNKTLFERHFTDAMDVFSDTFSDNSEFTKTKTRDEDSTKPSYSVTLGLQTDIPAVTDKIMYPRSAFILKCLKRLENKHKNVQDHKPSCTEEKFGRKNLFESLENVSSSSKDVCKYDVCSQGKETKNSTESCRGKNAIEEVVVFPKPVDPKNLEYCKPTFTIPSNEEILTYADDDAVVRKQPELDSVSPENGRDLLQIIAKTLGIFPSTKSNPQENHLKGSPKKYKEQIPEDIADDKDGMQIIVMNNTAESKEYTMGIDVINVPKNLNEELRKAATELENKVEFEDEKSSSLHFSDDSTTIIGKGSSTDKAGSNYHHVPGDISIPEEVYEFLEEYETASPSACNTEHIHGYMTQDTAAKNSIHLIPGPQVKTSEVVDIHFNICSKQPFTDQPESRAFSLSRSKSMTSSIEGNPLETNSQQSGILSGSSSANTANVSSQNLPTTHLQDDDGLPLYAIPVGYVSEDNQSSKTFLSLNQDINSSFSQSSSEAALPVQEVNVAKTHFQKTGMTTAFAETDVFNIENIHEDSGGEISKLPANVPDSNQDQLWSRILEEYKAERQQHQGPVTQNNHPRPGSMFTSQTQHQRHRTLSSIDSHTDSFISKPELTRSYSTSACSTVCDTSNPTLPICDNPGGLPSMTCSFSPTNDSHSLKLIFRKEKSPQEQIPPMNTTTSDQARISSDQGRISQSVSDSETVVQSNMSSAISDPPSANLEESNFQEGDSLPYMIVDTGVEICRKALRTEEDEDISDDDWDLEKGIESQDAVT